MKWNNSQHSNVKQILFVKVYLSLFCDIISQLRIHYLTGTSVEVLGQEDELFDGGDLVWHLHDTQQLPRVQRPQVDESRPTTRRQNTTIPGEGWDIKI